MLRSFLGHLQAVFFTSVNTLPLKPKWSVWNGRSLDALLSKSLWFCRRSK